MTKVGLHEADSTTAKSGTTYLFLTLRLPIVNRLIWEEIQRVSRRGVVGDNHKHIRIRIKVEQGCYGFHCQLWVVIPASIRSARRAPEKGFSPAVLLVRVTGREYRAWAWRWEPLVKGRLQWKRIRHRDVTGRSDHSGEMADVAAQKDESVWGRSDKGGNMTGGMAGYIENIQTAISEIIMGLVSTNFEVVAERRFDDLAILEIRLMECRIRICWVARLKSLLESGSDNQIGLWGQSGNVSSMVKVPVTENECLNLVGIYPAVLENVWNTC